MTSQADFDRFVTSQRGVRRLALRDLAAWFATVEHLSPAEAKAEARKFLPLLARSYGEVSGTAAADFYEAARADSAATGRFTARLASNTAAQVALRQVGWATTPLFEGDPGSALARMGNVVDASSLQVGRDTVIANSGRDKSSPRWARIPVGKTCAFCVMLGSRGAVYRSADTAGKDFHAACDCQPVPSWDHGEDLPPNYDEGHYFGLYDRARADAGSGDPKKITAAMRRLDGGVHVTDGVAPRI